MKIGITGITGRMGQEIAKLVDHHDIAQLSSGLVRSGNTYENTDLGVFLGKEALGRQITANIDDFISNCDAIIDFSTPLLSLEIAQKCAQNAKIHICGTTGFADEEKQKLVEYAKNCVIIWSSNMSIGVNLLMGLVEKAAATLRDNYDIEIVEMHHKHKLDAPSGTALSLGAAAAKGLEVNLQEKATMSRVGTNAPRQKGEIGFATLRGGDVIGDHSVIFAGEGERIELTHKATHRSVFASGSIRAAIWGSSKDHGFYTMKDVLGL